ncbi:ABC transporter ATP-binding protein [Enemella sp. A6]|uniref:ABC transporter ATP-binding protein n=1 Tax=Enemella sp. A6 TaxID=3440152 RepID=UPI003EB9E3A9
MSAPEKVQKEPDRQFGRGPHGMAMGGEKPKSFGTAMRRLVRFARPFLPMMVAALILETVSMITRLIGPGKISEITDLIVAGLGADIDMPSIMDIVRFLVIIFAIGAVFSLVSGLLLTQLTQRATRSLRTGIATKTNRLSVRYFQRSSTGDLLSRLTNDIDTIGQTMQNSLIGLVSSTVLFVGAFFAMAFTEWRMTLAAVGASVIGFAFMSVIMRRSQQYFRGRQRWLGKLNGHVEETYTGHLVVKAFNGVGRERAEFDRLNDEVAEAEWRSQFVSGLMQPLMMFMGNLGYVAVCVVGAVLVLDGSITFGTIVAFMLYIRLFTQPMMQLAQAATNLQSTAAASERVFEYLDAEELPPEHPTATRPDPVRGAVEFDHVRFGYDPDRPVIHDFTESFVPGETIAIVGPTGAGKTTLVNLLMRFYEVDAGEIRIDGVPITAMTRAEVRSMFDMVLQDTWLFEGTIEENIAFNTAGATREQIERACRDIGLDHYVNTLPEGLDTVLTDATTLSAGQRQLLTIARSIVHNAPMLILDEATSSVDTRTEVLVQQAMAELTEGRTSFVIAHRLSTIRDADRILVLDRGDVVESGSHDDLLAADGVYATLYRSQFDTAAD